MHPSDRFFRRFYLPRLINLHFQTYFAKKALIWFSIRLETKTLESQEICEKTEKSIECSLDRKKVIQNRLKYYQIYRVSFSFDSFEGFRFYYLSSVSSEHLQAIYFLSQLRKIKLLSKFSIILIQILNCCFLNLFESNVTEWTKIKIMLGGFYLLVSIN